MKRCMGCLEQYGDDNLVCPHCGLDSNYNNDIKKHLRCGTVIASRYTVGRAVARDSLFVSYIGCDEEKGCTVLIKEYFPKKVARRVAGKSDVVSRSYDLQLGFDSVLAQIIGEGQKLAQIGETVDAINIASCIEENSTVYLVSKPLTGVSLDELFAAGKRVGLRVALGMLAPLLEGLEALHAAGFSHGGVRPENIFVCDEGKIRLHSYQFDKVTATQVTDTAPVSPYEAPEVRTGGEIGAWTDIYAAAAVFYRIVAGVTVPEGAGKDASLLWKDREVNIPDKAKRLTEKALSTNPISRVRSAKEFLAGLTEAANDAEKQPDDVDKKKKSFLAAVFPIKGDPASEVVRKLVLLVSIAVMVVSAGILSNIYYIEPTRFKAQAQQTADLMNTDEDLNAEEERRAWEATKKQYPEVNFPEGMQSKFAELYVQNREIAGWISIPKLEINFPVMHCADNDKYIKKDFYGKKNSYGVPFVDYRNSIKDFNTNTIIYGHNMRHDDLVFGMLENYRDPQTFIDSPIIEFDTIYGDYTWKIYGVFITNSEPEENNGFVFNYNFTETKSDDEFCRFIAEVDKRRLYNTGVDIDPSDKLLVLSTCCYDFNDARLVVVARMVREHEGKEIDPSFVSINEDPRFPQAYYDAKGEKNSHLNDENWNVS